MEFCLLCFSAANTNNPVQIIVYEHTYIGSLKKAPSSRHNLYKKHSRACAITAKGKQMVMNVYSCFRKYCDGSTVEKVVSVTAAACGVSNTIVYECKKEMKKVKDGHVMHPSKETLNSPSSRVDADSTSRRRRILRYIFSGVGES